LLGDLQLTGNAIKQRSSSLDIERFEEDILNGIQQVQMNKPTPLSDSAVQELVPPDRTIKPLSQIPPKRKAPLPPGFQTKDEALSVPPSQYVSPQCAPKKKAPLPPGFETKHEASSSGPPPAKPLTIPPSRPDRISTPTSQYGSPQCAPKKKAPLPPDFQLK
jgi:hypothetical protein